MARQIFSKSLKPNIAKPFQKNMGFQIISQRITNYVDCFQRKFILFDDQNKKIYKITIKLFNDF